MKTMWLDMQRGTLNRIDALALRSSAARQIAPHLSIGLRGEREALFELRRLGYTVVARRWTSSRFRGDLDLVAWEGDRLCFIEVKTRSHWSAMAPAETAVDRDKQATLRRTGRLYLRSFPEEKRRQIQVRFDVIAVYLNHPQTVFELFRGAFEWQ